MMINYVIFFCLKAPALLKSVRRSNRNSFLYVWTSDHLRFIAFLTFACLSVSCASQVMLAASYWSLLAPAIDMAEDSGKYGSFAFVPVAVGFTLGAAFVYFADLALPLLVRNSHTYPIEFCALAEKQKNDLVCDFSKMVKSFIKCSCLNVWLDGWRRHSFS